MKLSSFTVSGLCASLALAFTLAAAPSAQAQGDQFNHLGHDNGFTYQQHNLVSDGFVFADHTDANLVNAWGIAFNPYGPVWVANNGSGTSTLYDGNGDVLSLVVQIPTADKDSGGPATGMVYNGSKEFVVTKGTVSGPAAFIFASEDGIISGWSAGVDLTHALTVVPASSAIYKGLAISADGNGGKLYATDFYNAKVDVFDGKFQTVPLPPTAFQDPRMPRGYAPFGIQNIHGDIYVSYAKQGPARHDEVHGRGLGFVDAYSPSGEFLRRVASGGSLNAPWGMTMAPAGFGVFGNTLLVGNFGDGRITAYDPVAGWSLGYLRGANFRPLQIDGLWGLSFGNGYSNQSVDSLYFTAGPDDEKHGLYGRLDPIVFHDGGR